MITTGRAHAKEITLEARGTSVMADTERQKTNHLSAGFSDSKVPQFCSEGAKSLLLHM